MSESGDANDRPLWPPDWEAWAAENGDASLPERWATNPLYAAELAVWRTLPDVTRLERRLAGTPLPGLQLPPPLDRTLAYISALRRARASRLDISNEDWEHLIAGFWPRLGDAERQSDAALLAAVSAVRPARRQPTRPRGRPKADLAQRRREVRAALASIRAESDEDDVPTREEIAEKLGYSPRTLLRWAAADPDLRKLLPSAGSPRRKTC